MPNWFPGQNAVGVHVIADPVTFARGFASQPPVVTAPGTIGSGTAVANSTGFDCMVYASATTGISKVQVGTGTGSTVTAGGTIVPAGVAGGFYVPAGQTINITYTGTLTWAWQAV